MKISLKTLFRGEFSLNKGGLKMGRTTILAALLLSSSLVSGQITIPRKTMSLQQALFQIRHQSGYDLFFDADMINQYPRISIELKDVPVDKAVQSVLQNLPLDYQIKNKTISILPKKKATTNERNQQQQSTKGVVVDAQGNPISGASIRLISDRKKATSTNSDGSFTFPGNIQNQEIEVSNVGYETRVIRVQGSTVRVVLESTDNRVEEVVVTGISARKKETFTGASASFNTEELKQVGNTNVIQSLKALDPSFLSMENNLAGSNPNALATIELRGQTSIATDALRDEFSEDPNQPLFILDGFPTTLRTITDMDINRIASVTILKDAASTAIYGSRASNGVIVIETIAPKPGELLINYSTDINIDAPDLRSYNMMNAAEKVEFERLSGRYTIHPRRDKYETQIELDALYAERLKNIARGVDSYWLSDPVQTAVSQRHSLMVNGGDGSLTYGIGGDYRKNNGAMKGSSRDTWGTRLNVDFRHKNFRASNMLYINGYGAEESNYGSFSNWVNTNPYYEKAPSSQPYLAIVSSGYSSEVEYISNPLYLSEIGSFDRTKNYAITNNTKIRWDINSNWTLNGALQIYKDDTEHNVFISPRHTQYRLINVLEKGRLTNSEMSRLNYTANASVVYHKVFAGKHSLNGQVHAEVFNSNANSAGFIAVGFPTFSTGAARYAYGYLENSRPQSSAIVERRNSLISTFNYSYDNKYNADFTFSYDGSTAFGVDNLYSPFFSGGLSWNLHKEQFFNDVAPAINLLRLRGNYGLTGNQNFTSYTSITTYDYESGYNFWGQGVNVSSLGNKKLKWQNTETISLGLDFAAWNSRLSGYVNAYRKFTDPLVVAVALPSSTSLSRYPINAGNLTVDGVEVYAKYAPIYKLQDRIIWTIGLMGSTYKQEYNDFNSILESMNSNLRQSKSLIQYRDGGDPADIWTVPSLGIDPATGNELFMKKDGTYSFQYDYNDAVVVGNSRPKLQGVFTTNLVYKGFSANVIVRYLYNQDVFNSALYNKVENISMQQLLNSNQDKRALYDRWKQVGDVSSYKRINLIDLGGEYSDLDSHPESTPMSSRFVQQENRLAIESISLGYDIRNTSWLNKIRMSNLKITGYMNDIGYFSTVKRERGIDYPYTRSFSLSLTANIK